MKDDLDFSIHFAGIIEDSPCIHNHNISDYSNKNVIDNTRENILRIIIHVILIIILLGIHFTHKYYFYRLFY